MRDNNRSGKIPPTSEGQVVEKPNISPRLVKIIEGHYERLTLHGDPYRDTSDQIAEMLAGVSKMDSEYVCKRKARKNIVKRIRATGGIKNVLAHVADVDADFDEEYAGNLHVRRAG